MKERHKRGRKRAREGGENNSSHERITKKVLHVLRFSKKMSMKGGRMGGRLISLPSQGRRTSNMSLFAFRSDHVSRITREFFELKEH